MLGQTVKYQLNASLLWTVSSADGQLLVFLKPGIISLNGKVYSIVLGYSLQLVSRRSGIGYPVTSAEWLLEVEIDGLTTLLEKFHADV